MDILYVVIDYKRVFYDVVEYFIKKGKKNILCVIGNEDIFFEFERKEGYRKVFEENGLEFREENVIRCSYGWVEFYEKLKNFCCFKKYDVIVCFLDLMVVGVIKAVKVLGFKIFDEFFVIGFDNIMMLRLYEFLIIIVV